MGRSHDFMCGLGVSGWQRYVQLDGKPKTGTVVIGADPDMRYDHRLAKRDFLIACDAFYRAVEAGGVACGEEFLRIRPATRSTHLRGYGHT